MIFVANLCLPIQDVKLFEVEKSANSFFVAQSLRIFVLQTPFSLEKGCLPAAGRGIRL
jgi:hypothetical protein